MIRNLLPNVGNRIARSAIFMSGSGTNAEVILENVAHYKANYEVCAIVTDRPKESRAKELSSKYNCPLYELDIKDFYAKHGESSIALVNDRRVEIRELWTNELRKILKPCNIDFGILAGFIPLCNITADYPCLNIHPGDLTVNNADGSRRYVGLHTRPIELAIKDNCKFLRSSVIIAQAFSDSGAKEMDSGPILGVSPKVEIELQNLDIANLSNEELKNLANINLEKLKYNGDHVLFPLVVDDFAKGMFGCDSNGNLYFQQDENSWKHILTIEYSNCGTSTQRVFL